MTEKKKGRAPKLKFTPEHAEILIELGKQGASQKAMYAAIGISKRTASRWKDDDPAFAEAMDMATTHGQAYWENMLLANIDNKGFNSRIAEIALRGQYPDDYRERLDVKANVKQEVVVDYKKEVDKLFAALGL